MLSVKKSFPQWSDATHRESFRQGNKVYEVTIHYDYRQVRVSVALFDDSKSDRVEIAGFDNYRIQLFVMNCKESEILDMLYGPTVEWTMYEYARLMDKVSRAVVVGATVYLG